MIEIKNLSSVVAGDGGKTTSVVAGDSGETARGIVIVDPF